VALWLVTRCDVRLAAGEAARAPGGGLAAARVVAAAAQHYMYTAQCEGASEPSHCATVRVQTTPDFNLKFYSLDYNLKLKLKFRAEARRLCV
jgi:hypothetical protein